VPVLKGNKNIGKTGPSTKADKLYVSNWLLFVCAPFDCDTVTVLQSCVTSMPCWLQ